MAGEYRSSILKIAIEDHSGQHNGFEITMKWQEGLANYPAHNYREFGLNLTIHLQPASVIHIQLLHKESILEEEKILGVDGFKFVRRDKMDAHFKVTRGPFIARFAMESSMRQIPDWREPLSLCPVFQGIQDHYGGPWPEGELKITAECKPYYLNHDNSTAHWLVPPTPSRLSRGPIVPDAMPEGWIRQWPVNTEIGNGRVLERSD